MEFFPVVFIVFKVLVLGIGMFFAVKWHYEKGKQGKEGRAAIGMVGKVVVGFVVALSILLFVTFLISKKIGLNLCF